MGCPPSLDVLEANTEPSAALQTILLLPSLPHVLENLVVRQCMSCTDDLLGETHHVWTL